MTEADQTVPGPDDKLSARRLILQLLSAAPAVMGASAWLVRAGELFGFNGNQVRVALSRLVADGLLISPRRGHYQLAGDAETLRAESGRWRQLEDDLVPWQSQWCGLLVDTLSAEGSTAFRRQTRALELRGLRRWKPGLWVRPDNLSGGAEKLAADVAALGGPQAAGTVTLTPEDDGARQQLLALWDIQALNNQYQSALDALSAAQKRLRAGTTGDNLRETIETGGAVIRLLLFDPLLPDALLAGNRRQTLIQRLADYDQAGQRIWQDFVDQLSEEAS